MVEKSVLVILRCGDQSLHRPWRNKDSRWDLAASYFGNDPELQFPEARYVHRYKGGKWDGIYNFCKSNPDVLEKYDYFWFPDDDIAADPDALNRLFRIVEDNNFELAQPSLQPGSYCSHLITLHNSKFQYRNVNFVELMVPLVSRELFVKLLPLFEKARTGFGIDFVWNRFTSDPSKAVAIIDAVQVKHTRAVGGALHAMIKKTGVSSAQEEQDEFLKPYDDVSKILISFGGLTVGGRKTKGRISTTLLATLGWLSRPFGNHGFTQSLPAPKFMVWVTRQMITSLNHQPCLEKASPFYSEREM